MFTFCDLVLRILLGGAFRKIFRASKFLGCVRYKVNGRRDTKQKVHAILISERKDEEKLELIISVLFSVFFRGYFEVGKKLKALNIECR